MNDPKILVWLLIEQDGTVLLGRRKPDRPPFADIWTLPGGLMREEESASETVARLGREQLDITPAAEEFVHRLNLQEGGVDYAINVFRVAFYTGRPRFRESGPYMDVRWVSLPELRDDTAHEMPELLRESLGAVAEGRKQ